LTAESRTTGRLIRQLDNKLPWGYFIACLCLSFFAWNTANTNGHAMASAAFKRQSVIFRDAVQERLFSFQQVLVGVSGLFASSKMIERHEWAAYINRVGLSQNFPEINSVGFVKIVTAEQRLQFLSNTELPENYHIFPAGERERYSPVLFVAPQTDANQTKLGFDHLSDTQRTVAMSIAIDLSQVSVSERTDIRSRNTGNMNPGVVLYVPVYKPGLPLETAEQRELALDGFIYGDFELESFISYIRSFFQRDLDIRIDEVNTASVEHLLYNSAVAPRNDAVFTSVEFIELPLRPW